MWLGGAQFYGGAILWKETVYIWIVYEELSKSGYSQDVDWTLWVEHASRDYVEIIFIDIISKYQIYRSGELCLGGQSFRSLQRDYGGLELASKQFALIADYCGGRIVYYKWNSICIP